MTTNLTIITSGSDITDEVRTYIADHFLADFGPDLNSDTDLFAAGVIDSFGFAELVVFLETRFNVQFEGEELTADNLNTVSNMVNTIRKKLDAS